MTNIDAVAMAALLMVCSAPMARAATVVVAVTDVPANEATVYASLCSGSLDPGACGFGERQRADAGQLRFTFNDVPPGRYAFLAFQDVNGSGTLERSRMGLPLVPYALSNNAGQRRRPSFDQAAFTVDERGYATTVRMHQLRGRTGEGG